MKTTKHIIRIIATLLIAVMLLTASASASQYVKFTKNAAGYKHPGSGKTHTVVKKGSVSYIETTRDGWTKVILGQCDALWFRSDCLKKTKNGSGTVMYSSGGEKYSTVYEGAGEESYKTKCHKVKAVSGKCNIRKQPCLSGKSLGTLHKGESLKYLGKRRADNRGVYWYKVKTNGGSTAWVSSVYTEPVK